MEEEEKEKFELKQTYIMCQCWEMLRGGEGGDREGGSKRREEEKSGETGKRNRRRRKTREETWMGVNLSTKGKKTTLGKTKTKERKKWDEAESET